MYVIYTNIFILSYFYTTMLLYMHVLRLITNRKYYILLCCYIIQFKCKFFRSIVSSKELPAVSGGHYTVSPPLIQRSRRGATVMGRSCRYRPTFSLGLSYSWTFRWTWILWNTRALERRILFPHPVSLLSSSTSAFHQRVDPLRAQSKVTVNLEFIFLRA